MFSELPRRLFLTDPPLNVFFVWNTSIPLKKKKLKPTILSIRLLLKVKSRR